MPLLTDCASIRLFLVSLVSVMVVPSSSSVSLSADTISGLYFPVFCASLSISSHVHPENTQLASADRSDLGLLCDAEHGQLAYALSSHYVPSAAVSFITLLAAPFFFPHASTCLQFSSYVMPCPSSLTIIVESALMSPSCSDISAVDAFASQALATTSESTWGKPAVQLYAKILYDRKLYLHFQRCVERRHCQTTDIGGANKSIDKIGRHGSRAVMVGSRCDCRHTEGTASQSRAGTVCNRPSSQSWVAIWHPLPLKLRIRSYKPI